MNIKCTSDCMIILNEKEIGFSKNDIVTDKDIIKAVKGDKNFISIKDEKKTNKKKEVENNG